MFNASPRSPEDAFEGAPPIPPRQQFVEQCLGVVYCLKVVPIDDFGELALVFGVPKSCQMLLVSSWAACGHRFAQGFEIRHEASYGLFIHWTGDP